MNTDNSMKKLNSNQQSYPLLDIEGPSNNNQRSNPFSNYQVLLIPSNNH